MGPSKLSSHDIAMIEESKRTMAVEFARIDAELKATYLISDELFSESEQAFEGVLKSERERLGVSVKFPVSRKLFILGYSFGRKASISIDGQGEA